VELLLVSNGFGDCQGSQLVARGGMDSLELCREGLWYRSFEPSKSEELKCCEL
jgi:hypothetical protein